MLLLTVLSKHENLFKEWHLFEISLLYAVIKFDQLPKN